MSCTSRWAMLVVMFAGCASPSLDGVAFSCEVDADCPAGDVCVVDSDESRGQCVARNTKPITLGFSGPLEGSAGALGREVKRGIQACLAEVNDQGGLFGRLLELRALNDDGSIATARANGLELLDVEREVTGADNKDQLGNDSVFAMLGSVGAGAALELAPLFTKNRKLFFAPTTGLSTFLRDGTDSSYVFNVRAGYRDEASAIIDYLAHHRVPRVTDAPYSHRRLLAVTRDDRVGADVYDALTAAYDREVAALPSLDAVPHFVHLEPDPGSVDEIAGLLGSYLDDLLMTVTDSTVSAAIVMATDCTAAASLIREIKDWVNQSLERAQRLDVQFVGFSLVGGDCVLNELSRAPTRYTDVRDGETQRAYADGAMIMQPVPHFGSASNGAVRYRAAMAALDDGPGSFASLEGYVGARLLIEVMQRTGRQLSTDAMLRTLATDMDSVDLQLGVSYSFSEVRSDASDSVWATVLREEARVETAFVWRRGEGIVSGAW